MSIPGGWLLTVGGAAVLRAPTVAQILRSGAERGLVQIEHRIARRTGEPITVHQLERGTQIVPAHGRRP